MRIRQQIWCFTPFKVINSASYHLKCRQHWGPFAFAPRCWGRRWPCLSLHCHHPSHTWNETREFCKLSGLKSQGPIQTGAFPEGGVSRFKGHTLICCPACLQQSPCPSPPTIGRGERGKAKWLPCALPIHLQEEQSAGKPRGFTAFCSSDTWKDGVQGSKLASSCSLYWKHRAWWSHVAS